MGLTFRKVRGFHWAWPCQRAYDEWTEAFRKRVPGISLFLEGPTSPVFASSVRELSCLWTGSLSHFRRHRNDEHLEALIAEALRFTGMHLENDLSASPYWSKAPLARRVALLLYLVNRGVVIRVAKQGRMTYTAREDASAWAVSQPSMASYLVPTLEFLAALQSDRDRRAPDAAN